MAEDVWYPAAALAKGSPGLPSITQDNDGIGEVCPLQIPLNQAGMARIVFYYQ